MSQGQPHVEIHRNSPDPNAPPTSPRNVRPASHTRQQRYHENQVKTRKDREWEIELGRSRACKLDLGDQKGESSEVVGYFPNKKRAIYGGVFIRGGKDRIEVVAF